MRSGHRLVQDQNISHRGRGIAGGSARKPAKTAKRATGEVATATVTERKIQHLIKVADGLEAVAGKCVLEADEETVHRLRTGSRRVQATVETMLRQAGAAGKSFGKPARLWLRSIKNIRRAAGPVRDLDVHRKLLEKSIARWAAAPARPGDPSIPPGAGGHSDASKGKEDRADDANYLIGQAKKLDDWLKGNRDTRAETLRKKIKKTREKLEQRRAVFRLALQCASPVPFKPRRSSGLVALEDFVRVVDAMPLLDSRNLHDFRKLTKKARYVAESGEDQWSQTIAKALKRVQDAIGDWHDWESLAGEAKIALGKDGDELTAWLEDQVEQFLAVALRTTERVRGQLLGEWMSARRERRKALQKPPAKASQTRQVERPRHTPGAA